MLTSDELYQLEFLSVGYSLADIAEEFGEHISSTKRRQTQILQKLGARNGTHAVALAIRSRYVQ